jgi:exopolyphosphatase/guanosine-5'-triphosphate,3'-diphosphate pyrophosphatase
VSRHFAVISIGTNSTRVLLADMAPEIPHVDLALSIGTRIGEGLGERGALGIEPMRRTLDAVRSHFRAVRGHYVRIFAIATSALRRAENGEEFAKRVEDIVGVPLRILSGDEEAEASYRGAITALMPMHGEEVGVVDVGGGSTEYAIGNGPHSERAVSCEIGAVRLTEQVHELAGHDGVVDLSTIERARNMAREALAPIKDFRSIERVALVGGSATTAAAVARGKRKVESLDLTRQDLQRTLVRLCSLSLEERKSLPGMKPQRADILPGGIIVLDAVLELTGRDRAIATTSDLLLGYLLQQRDAAPSTHAPGYPHPDGTPGRTPGITSRS